MKNNILFSNTQKNFLISLFDCLNTKNIKYLILRNYEDLPNSMPKPDIGLLIDPQHSNQFKEIFFETAKKFSIIALVKPNKVNIISFYANFSIDKVNKLEAPIIKFDVRQYQTFQSSKILEKIPLLKHRIFYSQVKTREIKINSLKLKTLDIKDYFIFTFYQLGRKKDEKYSKTLLRLKDRNEVKSLLNDSKISLDAALKNIDSNNFYKNGSSLCKVQWGNNINFNFTTALNIFIKNFKIRSKWIFYLSGPDGAGKTTSASIIEQELSKYGFKVSKHYCIHKILRKIGFFILWGYLRIKDKESKISFNTFRTSGLGSMDRKNGSKLWIKKKYLSLIFSLIDIQLGRILLLIPRLRGHICIIETSPYDIFVKYHMPENKLLYRKLSYLIPEPLACFLLTANAENINKRKNELSVKEINNYYQRISDILNYRIKDKYIRVSTLDIVEIRKKITKLVPSYFEVLT